MQTKQYFIIVKGNLDAARTALADREIVAFSIQWYRADIDETAVDVTTSDIHAIPAWFIEPVESVKGEGFPAGSLLWYRER
jgi:hypothetical protein